jgi:hypothetical protein
MANRKSKKKNTETVLKKYWKWILLIISILLVVVIVFIVLRTPKPVFDGNRAYKELVKQVEFGPRISRTVGHDKTKEYLVSQLKQCADMVSEETFDFKDKHDSSQIYKGVNIVASFNVSADVTRRILLCAHWDSRPFADNDPDSAKHALPVPAANDGASGVAVLLEMAQLFSESKPKVGVDIVFFDLEDIFDSLTISQNLAYNK